MIVVTTIAIDLFVFKRFAAAAADLLKIELFGFNELANAVKLRNIK
jgi:hypothetical protein